MKLLDRIREKTGYSNRGRNEPARKLSPARVRVGAIAKLLGNVSFCLFLLVKASVSIGLLIVPLLYSFRYLPEIYAGKTFSETSSSERGVPILMAIALMLVLTIFLFLWISEEAAKQPAFPGAIPQQSK